MTHIGVESLDEIKPCSPRSVTINSPRNFLSSFTCQEEFFKQFDSSSLTLELIDFFQKAPIGLHWLSHTGLILWANDEELRTLGYDVDEYIGHSITEFLAEGEDGNLAEVFGQLGVGNAVHDAPFKFRAKNGDFKYLIVDSNVNFNEDSSFRHTRCFIRNDTDRHIKAMVLAAETALTKKNEEARNTFIRNVFHEIRTPLHSVWSFFDNPEPTKQDFIEMKHQTDAIMGMIDDLTFSTTFEAGKVSSLYPVPLHLPSVIAQVADTVKAIAQKAEGNVAVNFHSKGVPSGAEDVIADPFFRRVLYCLLSNAVKFSPKNGVVDVTLSYTANLSPVPSKDEREYIPAGASPPVGPAPSTPLASRRPQVRRQASFVSPRIKRSTFMGNPDPNICMKGSDSSDESQNYVASESKGTFTFHFKNSTVSPMNVEEVRRFFNKFYHRDVNLDRSSGDDTEISEVDEMRGVDQKKGDQVSPEFRDLIKYQGLGLGLYTAYNMVSLMSGKLECSADKNDEACFWFSIPSTFIASSSQSDVELSLLKIDDTKLESLPGSLRQLSDNELLPPRRGSKEGVLFLGHKPMDKSPIKPEILVQALKEERRMREAIPDNKLFSLGVFTPEPGSPCSPCDTSRPVGESSPVSPGDPCRIPVGSKPMRLLVVDDSPTCQKVIARSLAHLEFTFLEASNGEEAIKILSEKPLRVDAVLMDLRMPVMDGLTAIRICRTELGLTSLPIIALTAEVGSSIKAEAMKAGATWFLNKPAKSRELIGILRASSCGEV
eukprot:CAMPEP_0119041318 /NCGR_PEP_ID=MMETSP1177-20130426/11544_1 /TAXON_ID=2985 /ORGANISM="Ochromonas sp, Strain CCMP1899" /LENGTH=771 /DNA_ID=CAMNT_0007007269 /DNA_START=1030 /DNA_END=3345 /DNA_ORIENTATION=-